MGWIVEPYGGYHPVLACDRPPSNVYVVANLALWLPASPPFAGDTIPAANAFLSLPGRPLPSDFYVSYIASPAEGSPLTASEFFAALRADGLTYIPYTSLQDRPCPVDTSRSLHWVDGPAPGEGPDGANFRLWVFPTVAALEAEWNVGVDGPLGASGVHRPRLIECDIRGGTIYHNRNLLLLIGGGVWDDQPEFEARFVDAFLALER